jgi:diguanylate cyclase (GGDEF)-like protein/PAS domain S-box-containing protein
VVYHNIISCCKADRAIIPAVAVAVTLMVLPWFISLVYIGLAGLIYIITLSIRWGLRGGLLAASWATLVMVVAFTLQGGIIINIIVSLFVYILIGVGLGFITDLHRKQQLVLRNKEIELSQGNKTLNTILESTLFGVAIIDRNRNIRWVNNVVCKMAGVEAPEELIGKQCGDYLCPAQQQECPILDKDQKLDNSERILRRNDGQTIPILKSVTEIMLEGEEVLLETFINISEQKQTEEALAVRLAFEEMLARVSSNFVNLPPEQIDEGINYALQNIGEHFEVDRSYLYRFSEDGKTYSNTHLWCKEGIEGYFKKNQNYLVELTPWWIGELKSGRLVNIENVAEMGDEAALDRADFLSEEIKSIFALPLTLEGKVVGCFGFDTVFEHRVWTEEQVALLQVVAELITGAIARHDADRQIRSLSFYDQLTGLYNRRYFEHELERLDQSREHPIAVISADLDGLKLINDTIGHNEGDRYLQAGGEVLESSMRSSDVLARVGGDEFALLLPRTDRAAAELLVNRIRRKIEAYNQEQERLPLSISLGLAISESAEYSLEETYRMADNNMYTDKLQQGKKARAQIVSSLLSSLFERGNLAEGERDQVQELSIRLGQALKLPEDHLARLALFTQVYDLGKVGLPDSIIHSSMQNNKGGLTDAEREALHRHPESGYRIASASPELADVAELILKHHENYDGTGYPLGLKEDAIPVECRILSIAVAYSAMTNPRPYAETLSHEEALAELERCAGSQFDPKMVKVFAGMMR